MKKILAAALLLTVPLSTAAFAQAEQQAKDLFLIHTTDQTKGRPGARVRIELLRDGVKRFVPRDTEFQDGDKVKLHFAVNFPAYVEIYNWGSSGDFSRLFPFTEAMQRVNPTGDYVVPGTANQWFEFDSTPGSERLIFIFSAAPMKRPANSVVRKPSTKPQSKLSAGDLAPNTPAPTNDVQQTLDEINRRGLDEPDGRDLHRVNLKQDSYIFSNEQRLQGIVKDAIVLRHR